MHLFQFSQNAVFILQIFDFSFGITFKNNIFCSQHVHFKKSNHKISQLMTLKYDFFRQFAAVEIARSIYVHVNVERCIICGPK